MPRLTLNDITDELVKSVVTNEDLTAVDEYLDDLAASLGTMAASIANPLPYKVKRLAIAFVCREVCARKAGGAIGASYRSQESGDKWADKLPFWTSEVRSLEKQMSVEVMTGRKAAKSFSTIFLSRC